MLQHSASCPADFFPLGDARRQLPSQFASAPGYSFGKLNHGVGRFRIPPRNIRCSYLRSAETPGVGSYNMDKPPSGTIKAPIYTFGISGTVRDSQVRRFTEKGHVVGHCNLNNPGPARYFGGEKNSLLWTQPAWTQTSKNAYKGGHWDRPTPGPDAYSGEVWRESVGNQLTRPKWGSLDKRTDNPRSKRSCLIEKISTNPYVGPGTYRHATSLVSS